MSAIDLPTAPAVADRSSADDLLAQLASDEIDRLLVEAEEDAPPDFAVSIPPRGDAPAELAKKASVTAQPAVTAASAAKLISATAQPVEASIGQPVAAAPSSTIEVAKTDPQPVVNINHAPAAPVESPAAPVAATIGTGATTAPSDHPIIEPLERSGLLDVNADAPPARRSRLLAPLEWVSFPLDGVSERARENIGKAAIVTLVNSAAIIIYVLLTRRH